MISELKTQTQNILEEFNKSFSYDSRDLNRPSHEKILQDLIAAREANLCDRLTREFFKDGPLSDLLDNPQVTEIVVSGAQEIWYESQGQFQKWTDEFLSSITFKNFIERLSTESGINIDLSQPFGDGRWRGFRVHLACAPLAHCDFHLTLRRSNTIPWTLDLLQERGWASPEQVAGLKSIVRERKNILVVGPTGCGKTSVLSACLREISDQERVVIIEDTDELALPNSASSKLLARVGTPHLREVNMTELVKQSLRMRPFRLVVGEVRGAEAKDLLMALATGHEGSLGTLHAAEARQALIRLEMLVQMGAPQWQVHAIRQLIQLSLDVILVCSIRDGRRVLEGAYRLSALESFGFLLEQMF